MIGFSPDKIIGAVLVLVGLGTYIWFLVRTWSRGRAWAHAAKRTGECTCTHDDDHEGRATPSRSR